MISWAHGTTGTADTCAPSKSPSPPVGGALLDQGYLVAATDYEGLGTPGRHPYLVGESEGRGVIDIVRAAQQIPVAEAGSRYAVWGHSQGGHAAVFANQIAASYAPELDLAGSVAIAPASHVFALYPINQALGLNSWGFLVMWLAGIGAARPEGDLTRVFTPAGLDQLGVVDTGCAGDVFAAYADGGGEMWFNGNPYDDPVFRLLMAVDEPGKVQSDSPLLVAQGSDDNIVPAGATGAMVGDQCQLGQVVRLDGYPGEGHGSVVAASLDANLAWTADRFAGIPAPSGCATIPPPPTEPTPTEPTSTEPTPVAPAPADPGVPAGGSAGIPPAGPPPAVPARPVGAQPTFTG